MSCGCWQCWPESCQYSIQTKVVLSTPDLHYSHAAPAWHVTRDPGDPVTGDMVWVTIAPLSLLSLCSSLFQLTSASLVAGKTLARILRLCKNLADTAFLWQTMYNEVGGYNVTWYLIDGEGLARSQWGETWGQPKKIRPVLVIIDIGVFGWWGLKVGNHTARSKFDLFILKLKYSFNIEHFVRMSQPKMLNINLVDISNAGQIKRHYIFFKLISDSGIDSRHYCDDYSTFSHILGTFCKLAFSWAHLAFYLIFFGKLLCCNKQWLSSYIEPMWNFLNNQYL